MAQRPYQLLDHTADIRVRVFGKDLKQLFRNAALALFEISAQKKPGSRGRRTEVSVSLQAGTPESLLVDWLNELLSLAATRGLIFRDFSITRLSENSLSARAIGSPVRDYAVRTEIKAATYHQLTITKAPSGWKAEVIVDV